MDNYCFRRKRHSYAACDAALAVSHSIFNLSFSQYFREAKIDRIKVAVGFVLLL